MKASTARVICGLGILLSALGSGYALPLPSWWTASDTRIIEPGAAQNNKAVLTTGQLKHIAVQAKKHIDASVAGGASPEINALVLSFKPQSGVTYTSDELATIRRDNYAPATIGQLKAVAYPFYQFLLSKGYNVRQSLINRGYPTSWNQNYPWYPPGTPGAPAPENYGIAVLGQAKVVFSFDLSAYSSGDRDGNRLPDPWENQYFGTTGADPDADVDGDGLTNLQELSLGTDPSNPDSDWDGIGDNEERLAGKNPLSDGDAPAKRLAYFPFDRSDWASAEGCLPSSASGAQVSGFRGKGLQITGSQLHIYPWKRSDGKVNFGVRRGSVRIWFKPSWSTPAMTGYWSRIFELGPGWTGDGSSVFISLNFQANNPQLDFTTIDGFGHGVGGAFPLSTNAITAGKWYQIVATYSPTSRSVYLNGQLISTQTVVWNYNPDPLDLLASGLKFGSDGGQPINGILDEAETFNYELSASQIQSNYAANNPGTDSDGDGMPDSFEQMIINSSATDAYVDFASVLPGDDFDGDWLKNLEEWTYRTNPTLPDTDVDSMPDKYEVDNSLNPTVDDKYEDADGDSVPNIYEWANSTNPQNASSKPAPHYIVDPSGGGNYTTIQAAVNAASAASQDYRIIQVRPGTYTSSSGSAVVFISSTKKIFLVSSNGAEQTIVDGQFQRGGIQIYSEIALHGFSIINGRGSEGAGVYVTQRALLSSLKLLRNQASTNGGAISCYANTLIRNVICEKNEAPLGGAVYGSVGSSFALDCRESKFIANSAQTSGGAVYVTGSSGKLSGQNLTFISNAADNGGAIYNYGTQAILDHCTLLKNQATVSGASVGNYDSLSTNTTLTNSILWGAGSASEVAVGTARVSVTNSIVQGGFTGNGTGNTSNAPALTADGHLTKDSPARDAAPYRSTPRIDIDSEERPQSALSDIGSDEWLDLDLDGLPDGWETSSFGSLASSGTDDFDVDGMTNLAEYVQSSDPKTFTGVQGVAVPLAVDAASGSPSATISFTAYAPGTVTLKFYKFYYDLNPNSGDFGNAHFELIDTRSVSAQLGANSYVWNGMVGSPATYHNAEVVVVHVITGTDASNGNPAAYVAAPIINFGYWTTNWINDDGTGTTMYRNYFMPVSYTLLKKPLLLTTQYHHTLLSATPLKAGTKEITDWIPTTDNGGQGNGGTQGFIRPVTVTARELPPNAIIYENILPEIRNFTVQAYRTIPSNGEVGHIRFEVTKPTKVSLKLADFSLVQYPIYVRNTNGAYQEALDMPLAAGTYDFEFKALNYTSGAGSAKHFAFNKLRSIPFSGTGYEGYFRVRVTWEKDSGLQYDGSVAINKGMRWAYVYIE